jgi:uncharacterized protein YrrD
VVGEDGPLGRVTQVIVSPGSGEARGLVVQMGILRRREVIVPIEAVLDANEEMVRVRLTAAAMDELPVYRVREFVAAPAGWRTSSGRLQRGALFRLPPRSETRALQPAQSGESEAAKGGGSLTAGQTVVSRDGAVGQLDLVLLDPATHRATHFVVRRGALVGHDVIVPFDWVREFAGNRIVLGVDREQLERLPEYLPDDEIRARVLDAVWNEPRLAQEDVVDVEASVRDGIVELRGTTRTETARRTIEEVVRRVPGVLAYRNRVQSLEALAAMAVRHDESPRPSRVR